MQKTIEKATSQSLLVKACIHKSIEQTGPYVFEAKGLALFRVLQDTDSIVDMLINALYECETLRKEFITKEEAKAWN